MEAMILRIYALLIFTTVLCVHSFDTEILSWAPRIFLIKDFLLSTECDMIIDVTKNTSQYRKDTSLNSYKSVYLDQYPKLSPELQQIEKRIGIITGQPPHPDEEPMNIHHIPAKVGRVYSNRNVEECVSTYDVKNSDGKSLSDTCNLSISGVHHDKVQKEYSSSTVIIYLSDVSVGGGTVYPCLSRRVNQTINYCSYSFNHNARWYDGDEAVTIDQYKKHQIIDDNELKTSLNDLLVSTHYGCLDEELQPKDITRKALRTVASKGSAVIFYHNDQENVPEVDAWHAGCLPISDDKWTLQKFKELPKKYRRSNNNRIDSRKTVKQNVNDEL